MGLKGDEGKLPINTWAVSGGQGESNGRKFLQF